MMDPKTATEIPATIMVFLFAPSHTISKGANADFGRLLSTTSYGSRMRDTLGNDHRRTAEAIPKINTKTKLTSVS